MSCRDQDAGFTLVELLVALVASSMLLASLSWAIATLGHDLRGRGEPGPLAQIISATPTLTQMLEGAMLPGAEGQEFEGTADQLVAIVPPPLAAGPVGPVALTLRAERDGRYQNLVASMRPVDATASWPAPQANGHLLVKGAENIRFDYVARADSGRPQLPALIIIDFKLKAETKRIAIAPKRTSDGSCRFDPISQACR
jgi:prepilin-type N-terminal cleavage/methylation domain-containing protein